MFSTDHVCKNVLCSGLGRFQSLGRPRSVLVLQSFAGNPQDKTDTTLVQRGADESECDKASILYLDLNSLQTHKDRHRNLCSLAKQNVLLGKEHIPVIAPLHATMSDISCKTIVRLWVDMSQVGSVDM